MGSIAFDVTQGANSYNKSYTVPDADIDRLVAAYQYDANQDINGTATEAQVLLYVVKTWVNAAKEKVSSYETEQQQQALTAPAPISAT